MFVFDSFGPHDITITWNSDDENTTFKIILIDIENKIEEEFEVSGTFVRLTFKKTSIYKIGIQTVLGDRKGESVFTDAFHWGHLPGKVADIKIIQRQVKK